MKMVMIVWGMWLLLRFVVTFVRCYQNGSTKYFNHDSDGNEVIWVDTLWPHKGYWEKMEKVEEKTN